MSLNSSDSGSFNYNKQEKDTLLAGAGASLAVGTLDYLANRKQKDKKKRLLRSLAVGLGAGGATVAGKGLYDYKKWKDSYEGTGRIPFGITLLGSGSFDPGSDIPIVEDENGTPTISLFLRGARGNIDTGADNTKLKGPESSKGVSEQVSSAIVGSKALDKYIDRIQRASDSYAASHDGQRPKIRLIGHSKGGPAAVRLSTALKNRSTDLTVSDLIALDPMYVTPKDWLSRKDVRGSASNAMLVRPAKDDKNRLPRLFFEHMGSEPELFDFGPGLNTLDFPGLGHTSTDIMLERTLEYLRQHGFSS